MLSSPCRISHRSSDPWQSILRPNILGQLLDSILEAIPCSEFDRGRIIIHRRLFILRNLWLSLVHHTFFIARQICSGWRSKEHYFPSSIAVPPGLLSLTSSLPGVSLVHAAVDWVTVVAQGLWVGGLGLVVIIVHNLSIIHWRMVVSSSLSWAIPTGAQIARLHMWQNLWEPLPIPCNSFIGISKCGLWVKMMRCQKDF